MAAAKNAILSFIGKTGRTYSISAYTADTAGYINTFSTNGAAGATSQQFWRPPEDVVLKDFSMETGTTQTTAVLTDNGATKAGCLIGYVSHVSTNPARPVLNIPFQAGTLFGVTTI